MTLNRIVTGIITQMLPLILFFQVGHLNTGYPGLNNLERTWDVLLIMTTFGLKGSVHVLPNSMLSS